MSWWFITCTSAALLCCPFPAQLWEHLAVHEGRQQHLPCAAQLQPALRLPCCAVHLPRCSSLWAQPSLRLWVPRFITTLLEASLEIPRPWKYICVPNYFNKRWIKEISGVLTKEAINQGVRLRIARAYWSCCIMDLVETTNQFPLPDNILNNSESNLRSSFHPNAFFLKYILTYILSVSSAHLPKSFKENCIIIWESFGMLYPFNFMLNRGISVISGTITFLRDTFMILLPITLIRWG